MAPELQHPIRQVAPGYHVTAAEDVEDGSPVFDEGAAGIAVKQVHPPIGTARADLHTIVSGERYFVWFLGEADFIIPDGLAPAKGDTLYITNDGTHVLSKTSGAGKVKFGKVAYVGPERGLRDDMMTVNFDRRADF